MSADTPPVRLSNTALKRLTWQARRDAKAARIAHMNAAAVPGAPAKPRTFLARHRGFYFEDLGRRVPMLGFSRRQLRHLRALTGMKKPAKVQTWLMRRWKLGNHLKIEDKRPAAGQFTGALQAA